MQLDLEIMISKLMEAKGLRENQENINCEQKSALYFM